jgi:DNA-binding NarL/FixJ family response regulator
MFPHLAAARRVFLEELYVLCLVRNRQIIPADYALPQCSRPRALQLLQQQGRAIAFIVVSGTIGEDAAVAVRKAGASDYVL